MSYLYVIQALKTIFKNQNLMTPVLQNRPCDWGNGNLNSFNFQMLNLKVKMLKSPGISSETCRLPSPTCQRNIHLAPGRSWRELLSALTTWWQGSSLELPKTKKEKINSETLGTFLLGKCHQI